ncbi:MAG TPA: glycosyltransferase family 39 protein [Planctomycetota bacterium]|nr:glycosyltransferase family 39 protein [Planctomycetota bacterium]
MSDPGPPAAPRVALRLGLAAAALWLIVAATRLGDYGLTWDGPQGEYAHGEQYLGYLLSGDRAYLDFWHGPPKPYLQLEHRQPHLAWPEWLFPWYAAHTLTGMLSAASCRLLWDTLGWVPAMSAHNLPIALWVALLLAVLVRWAALRWGAAAGIAAALSLLLAPRFLADAFNNIKDAPEACLYALAVLAFAAALARPRPLRFALAGALTGLALAQKFNALFIPLQVLLYWALACGVRRARGRPAIPFPWIGAPVAAAAGLAAWLAVSPMLWTDTLAGVQAYVDYWHRQGLAPFELDPWDGVLSWLWTTPPVLLLLAALGACSPRLSADERCLLLLGVALPIGRTALPGAINFDGVRHFLEFQPFMALLAAAGAAWLLEGVARRWSPERRVLAAAPLLALLFATPLLAVVATWPHGTCYFNALVGGLGGAQARGIGSATDYWAGSYWQGLAWLNGQAESRAGLLVPVANQVAAAIAPVRLRADLVLLPPTGEAAEPPAVLYVMYVTRREFYDGVAYELDAEHAPLHELQVQGGTILRIHRFDAPDEIGRVLELAGDRERVRAAQRLHAWVVRQPPEVMKALLLALGTVSDRAAARDEHGWDELSAMLPGWLHDDARLVLYRRQPPEQR